MGNMLFEVLNSQILGAPHSSLFQEDLNFGEAFSYYPERTSNMTLIHMLEGMSTTANEDVENLDRIYSKLPVLREQDSFAVSKNQGALQAQRCQDDFGRPVAEPCSSGNLQTFRSRLAGRDSFLAQHPSTSQSSDPSSNLASSENHFEGRDEARLLQSNNQATLDEGCTSSTTPGPVQFSASENLAVQATSNAANRLPSLAADLTICEQPMEGAAPERKKRKRRKACKNTEEVESQRMTHIAVERNRRKQMNEHLTVLRSLMPGSYIQRGDQASIIGGAIEFVKELEQILQSLQLEKQRRDCGEEAFSPHDWALLQQFPLEASESDMKHTNGIFYQPIKELFAESKSSVANVEVKMVESSALVKVLAQKRPQQLLHILAAINSLHLMIMHLNITTIEETVLYSFNIEMGAECQIHSVNELALSIQHIFSMFGSDIE